MNPEIERLKLVMANAVKQLDEYQERIENPINQKTGRPLSRKTLKRYQALVRPFAVRIDLCEREIRKLMAEGA